MESQNNKEPRPYYYLWPEFTPEQEGQDQVNKEDAKAVFIAMFIGGATALVVTLIAVAWFID